MKHRITNCGLCGVIAALTWCGGLTQGQAGEALKIELISPRIDEYGDMELIRLISGDILPSGAAFRLFLQERTTLDALPRGTAA